MDPVEGVVGVGVEAFGAEHGDASVGGWDVGVEFVVLVFIGVDVGNGGFVGRWVCRNFETVVEGIPVGALELLVVSIVLCKLMLRCVDAEEG